MHSGLAAAQLIHHQLRVELHPAENSINVRDIIDLPTATRSVEFSLRNGLSVNAHNAELSVLGESDAGHLRHYRLNRLPADGKVHLSYHGKIVTVKTHGIFGMPEAVLDTDAIYLDNGSAWFPQFEAYPLYSFRLQVQAPHAWHIISQGQSKKQNEDPHKQGGNDTVTNSFIYDMPHPQNDIYLLGGQYRRYSSQHHGIEIVVYLYDDDVDLANSYLQASADYLELYNDWIGRYPYDSFAIVENRWQTGYGMPSFTLLGSRVLRLPFILHSSLPHEILHNWWGNGVYVDHSSGNWSEGLTAYMSDHHIKQRQGKDNEYRRKALERYANFAAEQRDFALVDFRSRHDDASQAVGYSKSLMLFHMLRAQAGAEAFDAAIRKFWQRYRFDTASFRELLDHLLAHDEDALERFAGHWLERSGAPELSLDSVNVEQRGDRHILTLDVSQQQAGDAYPLQVPLDVRLQGQQHAVRERLPLDAKSHRFSFSYDRPPETVTLDPDYDLFRLLHANERPSSLGRLFGAGKQWLVYPAGADPEQVTAWQQLASAWSKRYKNVVLVPDDDWDSLPEDAATWILGWNNRLLQHARERLATPAQSVTGESASLNEQQLSASKHAVVLLDADNSRAPLGFIGATQANVIASMAAKLPHYSSYGALAFELPGVNNIIKQHLPVQDSPMIWRASD